MSYERHRNHENKYGRAMMRVALITIALFGWAVWQTPGVSDGAATAANGICRTQGLPCERLFPEIVRLFNADLEAIKGSAQGVVSTINVVADETNSSSRTFAEVLGSSRANLGRVIK